MKTIIYTDPFTRKGIGQIVEILETINVPKKIKRDANSTEVATFHLFNDSGLKKALVKFSDGTIQDNVFFDPSDNFID